MLSSLFLGDSYTIGEAVPFHCSFPVQSIQLLRKQSHSFNAPEVLAKTGWTTDELLAAIKEYTFLPQYDFVTLLIGVNNQYRGYPASQFSQEFERLLNTASELASKPKNVFVLSIPDWGATPYAKDKDRQKISEEIREYNNCKSNICRKYGVSFLYTASDQGFISTHPEYTAEDGLHPSRLEYQLWAKKLAANIEERLR